MSIDTTENSPWASSLDKLEELGGVRRHIKEAPTAGATPEEIAVLQLCMSMGLQACAQGVPILAEELDRK